MSFETFGDLNYLAVLVAAVAYFAIGGVWYTVLFGKAYRTALGLPPDQVGNPGLLFVLSFVGNFVSALGLAFLALETGADGAGDGLLLGGVAAIGFAVAILWVTQSFELRPTSLKLINSGYHLVSLLGVGVIVSVWT